MRFTGVLQSSEVNPNDAMTLHRAKFQKENDEFISDGEEDGVAWKLYKGLESYFLWIHYGSLAAKLLWDGSMWIVEPNSRDTNIYGTGIEDIVKSVKTHVKEFD